MAFARNCRIQSTPMVHQKAQVLDEDLTSVAFNLPKNKLLPSSVPVPNEDESAVKTETGLKIRRGLSPIDEISREYFSSSGSSAGTTGLAHSKSHLNLNLNLFLSSSLWYLSIRSIECRQESPFSLCRLGHPSFSSCLQSIWFRDTQNSADFFIAASWISVWIPWCAGPATVVTKQLERSTWRYLLHREAIDRSRSLRQNIRSLPIELYWP